jgi:hypothetical protein
MWTARIGTMAARAVRARAVEFRPQRYNCEKDAEVMHDERKS